MSRRFLILGLTVWLAFCLWVSADGEKNGSGPRLVIKEPFYDFKELREGEEVSHSFRILNKGDQVLNINQVRPD